MFSIPAKPKFFMLNALRFLSLVSLLFILIANCIILMEDAKALKAPVDKNHEECDYVENSSIPNQPAGEFRAFFSLTLNLIQTLVLMVAEIEFSRRLFEKFIPCLGTESLVAIGVLEVLLAAQMMSHFLETFPLVACFFLLIAGILNIATWGMEDPKTSRSWGVWREVKAGRSPSYSEKGFGRHASTSDHSRLAQPAPVLTRSPVAGVRASPPNYANSIYSTSTTHGPFGYGSEKV